MTAEQIKEFGDILKEVQTGQRKFGVDSEEYAKTLKGLGTSVEDMQKQLDTLRKASLAHRRSGEIKRHECVSEDCAKYLGAIAICAGINQGKINAKKSGAQKYEQLQKTAGEILGVEAKTALTTSDIPMPVEYAGEVVELVWKFGQARQLVTSYPMSTSTLKLPQLKTTPAFAFFAASAALTELSPQVQFVTFTAGKAGGLIRFPEEIDADSIVALGQFLARYIAREMARLEDTTLFLGDGTSTYNSVSGTMLTADTIGTTRRIVTATGNTSADKITLANMRQLRTKVDIAALWNSAYHMSPTMEQLMVSFNTSATVTPYIRNGQECSLDGFPIKWIGVMPAYSTAATVSQLTLTFGDMSYWYMGVRAGIEVEASREVYFATDEIGIRALERYDFECMATGSIAVLKLAAS